MDIRTVHGTWTYPDGTPAAGQIVFTPARRIVDRAADGWVFDDQAFHADFAIGPADKAGKVFPVVAPAPVAVDLDAAGHMQIGLAVTGDADWVWLVTERIYGSRHAVWALTLLPGGPLNLGDVTADLLAPWAPAQSCYTDRRYRYWSC